MDASSSSKKNFFSPVDYLHSDAISQIPLFHTHTHINPPIPLLIHVFQWGKKFCLSTIQHTIKESDQKLQDRIKGFSREKERH